MPLFNLIPDPDVVCALEPEELALRMLPLLAGQQRQAQAPFAPGIQLADFISGEHLRAYGGQQEQVALAIREAWAWLEGQGLLIDHPRYHAPSPIKLLSRRALRLAHEPDTKRAISAKRLPKEDLHPRIREDVWAQYHRGKYDAAVFEAMREVEVAVREAAGLSDGDLGKDLMRKAFNPEGGPLTDMSAEKGEREARAHLFAGVISSYKNPQSHRRVGLDDPDEAAEIVMVANHLLRIVDTRREARRELG